MSDAIAITAAVLASAPRSAAGEPGKLPEGDVGIAAKYPGDRGIERDPAVLFHDDFEACSPASGAESQLRRKWDVVYGDLRIADHAAHVHGGERSLEMAPRQAKRSAGVGKKLETERDVLFLRWYARFDEGFDSYPGGHNGAAISAHYHAGGRSTPGERADGRNKWLVEYGNWRSGAETESPGPLFIYCYHPEQRSRWGDHFFPTGTIMPRGTTHPFGREFVARPDVIPDLGRWHCYEFMAKANAPGKRDGRIACWLDGTLVADFPGMRLRDVETLTIDQFSLGMYLFDHRRNNRKWSDDVVAATSYIGPVVLRSPAQKEEGGGRLTPAPKPDPLAPFAAKLGPVGAKAAAAEFAEAMELCAGLLAESAGHEGLDALRAYGEGLAAGAELRRVIVDRASVVSPTVFVDLAGRPVKATLLSADADGLRLDAGGSAMVLRWRLVAPRRFYGIAAKLVSDTPASHLLLARYCAAMGLRAQARAEIAEASADAGLADEIAALAPLLD